MNLPSTGYGLRERVCYVSNESENIRSATIVIDLSTTFTEDCRRKSCRHSWKNRLFFSLMRIGKCSTIISITWSMLLLVALLQVASHVPIRNSGYGSLMQDSAQKPRAVFVNDFWMVKRIDSGSYSINTEEEEILDDRRDLVGSEATVVREGEEDDECVSMYEWQDLSFPSCNTIHEIDLSNFRKKGGPKSRIVSHGLIRDVWDVMLPDKTHWALKTLRYEHKFGLRAFHEERTDAVVSERLTSSPHISNIYGYCAYTGLYEFARHGTLEDHYMELGKEDRLRAAANISRGLADLHTLGGGGQSPVIHRDIAVRQFIKTDEGYKLNDFNTAKLLKWQPKQRRVCEPTVHRARDKVSFFWLPLI